MSAVPNLRTHNFGLPRFECFSGDARGVCGTARDDRTSSGETMVMQYHACRRALALPMHKWAGRGALVCTNSILLRRIE